MSDEERKFREDRALRNAAHALVKAQFGQVRIDLAARGIGQRIADKATDGVSKAADHTLEVASNNRGVIAGTVAALLLWVFRNPLIEGGKHVWRKYRPEGDAEVEAEPEPEAAQEPWWRRLRFGWHKVEERSSD